MPSWIDYRDLREKLKPRFPEMLAHYKFESKKGGAQQQGFCPLPGHEGQRKSPSFSVNVEEGMFNCFGCGRRGNVLDLVVFMAGEDPKDGRAVRKAAVFARDTFLGGEAAAKKAAAPPPPPKPKSENLELQLAVNAPLGFGLKGLDHRHPYLVGRGFTKETMAHFGVGFCSRGMHSGKIAIPLHDGEGTLIGYGGRVIDDALISEDNPKYQLPGTREKDGTEVEFKKSLFLYNCHRCKRSHDLVVVEGFPSVWWLTQASFPRVVATMGADCSDEQADLIVGLVEPEGRVWIMPDGDKAGLRFAASLFEKIATRRFLRWVKLEDGWQPTDFAPDEIKKVLAC